MELRSIAEKRRSRSSDVPHQNSGTEAAMPVLEWPFRPFQRCSDEPCSSSNKLIKELEIDRLSALPDCLLISILSLLSTREAIRTCVLSRRWRFLCTELPALEFQEESYDNEKISKFLAGVRKYLIVHGGNHLQRFEVSCRYKKDFASEVDAWVQFALKHKVKHVGLHLDADDGYHDHDYLLPQMMYSNSYLTCLSLERCIMAPKNTIQWGALSSLYLDKVEFHGDAIEKILSGCPVLHDLTLSYCWHDPVLNCLRVKSQSLRELTIEGSDDFSDDNDNEKLVELSAPFIHYANFSVCVEGMKFELTDISSLVEADIDFIDYETDGMSKVIGYTTRLFENLRHAKKLEVGPECIWALGDMVAKEGMRLSQSRVECLELYANIYNKDTTNGILVLLESSPNIKKLFVSLFCDISQDGLQEFELNHEFSHLKTITITVPEMLGLLVKIMLTLVQVLLKRTPNLEKLVIDFSEFSRRYYKDYAKYTPPEFIKIAQTLLSYPRASTKVVVQVVPFSS